MWLALSLLVPTALAQDVSTITIVRAADLQAETPCGVYADEEEDVLLVVDEDACLAPSARAQARRILGWHRDLAAGTVDRSGPGRLRAQHVLALDEAEATVALDALDTTEQEADTWLWASPAFTVEGGRVDFTPPGQSGRANRASDPPVVELEYGVEGFTPVGHQGDSPRAADPPVVELEYGVEGFVPQKHLQTSGG